MIVLSQIANCVVPENIHTPTTEDHWKFRGRGGLKGSNFQGVGGFRGKLLFQRVTNHIQNIESNIPSIWSTKTHYRTMFWNKSQFWDKVNTISFNVSLFFLWVSKRYNLRKLRTMCLSFGTDSTGVSSPDFQLCLFFVQPTLPFVSFSSNQHFSSLEYRFSLPSHAVNTFLIGFMFYWG